MPELPEVEAVCRKLRRQAKGAVIVAAGIIRPSIAAPQKAPHIEAAMAGRVLEDVRRRGKNILLLLSGGQALHIHLRMTGNLYVIADARLRPAGARAWFELEGGRAIIFEDERALGRLRLLGPAQIAALDREVGPEPLDRSFTAAAFTAAARKSRQPAKIFLMDQGRVAGLGNIYAAEAIFRAHIHPERRMCRIAASRLHKLHTAIVGVLRDAIQSACSAYTRPGRMDEGEAFPVCVYGREGESCKVCGRAFRRLAQGGRCT